MDRQKFIKIIIIDYSHNFSTFSDILSDAAPLEALRKFNSKQFSTSIEDYNVVKKTEQKHRFMCVCGRTFLHSAHVRYHKRWECGQNLSCRVCSRRFVTISNLKRHLKSCMSLARIN